MSWNLEGKRVQAMYQEEVLVTGTVTSSRIKLGGRVTHYLSLEHDLRVPPFRNRVAGDTIAVSHDSVTRVFGECPR